MYLRSGAEKSRVKARRPHCAHTKAHIDPFEHVDVTGWPDASMVIGNMPADPLDFADFRSFGVELAISKKIASADARKPGIGLKMPFDARKPIGVRCGVVVGYRYDVALDAIQPGIERGDLSRYVNRDDF
jgi:hypothetical protein